MSHEKLGDLQSVEQMLAKLMGNIESVHAQLRSDFQKLNSKVEALTLKIDGDPPLKNKSEHRVSFGGGEAVSFGDGEAKVFETVQSPDGSNFDGDSRRNSQRFSMGSASSISQKDVGTKLERPKFHVEKSKLVDGIKTELVQDSDFINYLDDYDHYIEQWKSVPANEGLDYANEDKVAILNMPPKYAKKAAERIHWIYSQSELRFCTIAQVRAAKFWTDMTSDQLRIEIGKTAGSELSSKGTLDALKRVKWNSQYGIIDMMAFANFQHEFKKTVMRIEAGDIVKIEPIHMKDIVISALPDRSFQLELFSKFGQTGTMLVHDFAINLVFDEIEKYITSISKHGLKYTVNKQNRERESSNFGGKKLHHLFAQVDELDQIDTHIAEEDEEIQDRANMLKSNFGAMQCRYGGVGSDGKLKCKWLAGSEASCLFKHQDSDMQLKGKGVTKDLAMSPAKHTRKVNMSLMTKIDETMEHDSSEDDS
jgi:hypothetical protein